ncbi:MAG: hypothetical protein HN981_01765 [Candidatus Pacebacteria bacterium]|jgi:PleD family two-component response regulator|nr:hypothetical protein [Candidatus Paceibacterota bacterium]MBT4652732.1 hypothetical protein [Candidatus Paceibacterota bacterium]MBT6755889.1 hypothetical protein [Candidatus Paceibacterota bacterium]MBT6921102.1 hypothetical protein [Candidatus Paceibacterota bacterium]
MHPKKSALIIEPNHNLKEPYETVADFFNITKVNSLAEARQSLTKLQPDIFFMSSSFSPHLQLEILETFKNACSTQIIPLVFVVDLSQSLNQITGTSWGDTLTILHSRQKQATIKTLLKPFI